MNERKPNGDQMKHPLEDAANPLKRRPTPGDSSRNETTAKGGRTSGVTAGETANIEIALDSPGVRMAKRGSP